jgi:FdhE protein
MSEWRNFYDRTLEEIGRLKADRPELADLIDFYGKVLDAQKSVRERFAPDTDGKSAPIQPDDVDIDWKLYEELFDRVGALSTERTGEEVPSWSSVTAGDADVPRKLIEGLRDGEAPMDDPKVAHLACQALVPFLEAYAEELRNSFEDDKWQKGSCPVCGGEPLMGRLDKETGKRQLQCQLCRTSWSFPRLECPFCGCDDQKMLRYFYDEDDKTHRVEVCDECRRYLKTVDMREKLDETGLIAEDLATLHLDVAAEKEGYRKGGESR